MLIKITPFKKYLLTQYSFLIFLLSATFLASSACYAKDLKNSKLIRLATTTSTENSGLLNYLLPKFEKDTGYKTHVIAVGTGKALRMGRDGDVDVLLVHALKAEQKLVKEGHGEARFPVMYNDFVIVGPQGDPAQLMKAKTAVKALQNIAFSKSPFVSRGDDSGTNKKELGLWKAAGIDVNNDIKRDIKNAGKSWYREAGQGMGKVLQMAGEMNAYTLTDRGTWLAYASKSPLRITFEGDSELFNPYGIIAVSTKKYPGLNNVGAHALIEWISSDRGQHLIGTFKVAGKVLFTPHTASIARFEHAATN